MLQRFFATTLLFVVASVALAQDAPRGVSSPAPRPLTAREGLGIAQAAAEQEGGRGRRTDCSHLVNHLYRQVGYPYPYASSLDLYRGLENFVRVRAAQPGDLVVWRGHVGIVLDPMQHSFFSSVRAGARTEYYDSPYWQARGRPRFYRYLTESPALADDRAAPVLETGTQIPPASAKSNRRAESRPAANGSETAMQPANAPLTTVSGAPSKTDHAGPRHSQSATETLVRGARGVPGMQDVAEALAERNRGAAEIFNTANLQQLETRVIVYRDLQVMRVEIKGKRGTARIAIESLASLEGTQMEPRRLREEVPAQLQRTKKGWVVSAAKQSTYVPRDAALRILSARLAALTQVPSRDSDGVHRTPEIGESAVIFLSRTKASNIRKKVNMLALKGEKFAYWAGVLVQPMRTAAAIATRAMSKAT